MLTPDGKLVSEEERPLSLAMRGEIVPTRELIIRRPNGSEVPVLVSASPVVRVGVIEGVVLVFENISILKELQQSREEWAALVAHDLRQPLNVLMLQIHTLPTMAAGGDPAMLYKISDQMKNSVMRIARMVSDLMDVSQIESNRLTLERRLLDLDSLVREVAERQKTVAPDRRLELHVNGPILKVYADSLRIDEVLTNLLTNALKYSDPATPIDVEVRTADNKVIVLATRTEARGFCRTNCLNFSVVTTARRADGRAQMASASVSTLPKAWLKRTVAGFGPRAHLDKPLRSVSRFRQYQGEFLSRLKPLDLVRCHVPYYPKTEITLPRDGSN